jgi:hypothetical protein
MDKGQPRGAARPDLVAALLDPAATRVSADADLPPDALRAVAPLARAAGVTLDGVPDDDASVGGEAWPGDGSLRVASVRVHRVVLPLRDRLLLAEAPPRCDDLRRFRAELRWRGAREMPFFRD